MAARANRIIVFFVCILACLVLTPGVYAADSDRTETEIKQMAQSQFSAMYTRAVNTVSPRLEAGEHIKPFAVITDKGNNVKLVRIKQIEEMPDGMALEVLRRSLRALVSKGKIGASAIFYETANPNEGAQVEKVLVSEMEHIFGPTLAQLIPFTVKAGGARFGDPVVVDMERTVFKIEVEKEENGSH